MVIVECIVLGIVTVAAFAHPHQNLAEVTFHPTVLNNGELVAVGFAVMLATLAPAFNVINGYDAALGFSEELKGGERNIAKAVIIAGGAGVRADHGSAHLCGGGGARPRRSSSGGPGARRLLGAGIASAQGRASSSTSG